MHFEKPLFAHKDLEVWLQRLLEELKQSYPLNADWNIFRSDNYCLQLIIMGDYMPLFGNQIINNVGGIGIKA